MKHITAEEFLKQDENVQEMLRKWCEYNLQVHDLVVPIDHETREVIDSVCMITQCMDTSEDEINIGRVFYLETCLLYDTIYEIVPLLNLQQLIDFIEDKTETKVQIIYNNSYTIDVGYSDDFKIESWDAYEDVGQDLLEAMWKVACKVVQEVNEIEANNAHS